MCPAHVWLVPMAHVHVPCTCALRVPLSVWQVRVSLHVCPVRVRPVPMAPVHVPLCALRVCP